MDEFHYQKRTVMLREGFKHLCTDAFIRVWLLTRKKCRELEETDGTNRIPVPVTLTIIVREDTSFLYSTKVLVRYAAVISVAVQNLVPRCNEEGHYRRYIFV